MEAWQLNLSLLLRFGWACALRFSGMLHVAKRSLRREGSIVVLMLHRVLPEEAYKATTSLPATLLRQRTFDRLTALLRDRYENVDILKASPGRPGRKLRVAVTFDDGWHDLYTTCFPVARQHGIHMAVFVCPGLTGNSNPFWPERVAALLRQRPVDEDTPSADEFIQYLKESSQEELQQWLAENGTSAGVSEKSPCVDRTLTWDEIEEMAGSGITFGSHTLTHQILTRVKEPCAEAEITRSKTELELRLGRPCIAFAYPNGNYTDRLQQIVAEAGFRLAFSTERGAWSRQSDPLAIPRINVCEEGITHLNGSFSPTLFEYTVFWKAWLLSRRVAQ